MPPDLQDPADTLAQAGGLEVAGTTPPRTVEPQDTPPTSGPPVPKTQKPPSIGGFTENVAKDAWENIKGIGGGILTGFKGWIDAPSQLYDIWKGRQYWDQAPFMDELKKTRDKLGDAMIEKYTKYTPANAGLGERVGQAFYNEPIGSALDWMVLKDIVAGGAKTVGRMGIKPVGDLGEALASFPGKQIGQTAEKVADRFGVDLPARRLTIDIMDEETSLARERAIGDKNAVLSSWSDLSPEQRQAAHTLALRGATPEELALYERDPAVMKAADAYKSYVEDVRQETLKARGVADDGTFESRLARQYGKARGVPEAQAYEDMQGLARKPVYVPTEPELRSGRNLDELLMEPQTVPQGKVGFLEKFTGKNPLSEDPRKYIPRVIDSFRQTDAKFRTYDRIISEPSLARSAVSKEALAAAEKDAFQTERALNKVKGTAEAVPLAAKLKEQQASLGLMRESVAEGTELSKTLPTTGFYKKYIDEQGRAQRLYMNELTRQYGSESKALEAMRTQQGVLQRLNATSEIIANPTVRRMLQMEFTSLGGLPGSVLRAYDKMLGLFKAGGTSLNPRWYLGISVGNAILSLIAGAFPGGFKLAREAAAKLPMQVSGAKLAPEVAKMVQGPFHSLADFHDAMGASVKAGMVSKFTARRLEGVAANGDLMEKGLRQSLPDVLNSTRNLSEFQVARGELHEAIAKDIGKRLGYDREIAEAKVAYQKAEMELYPKTGAIPERAADLPGEVVNKTLEDARQKIVNLETIRNAVIGEYEAKAIAAGELAKKLPETQRMADIVRASVRDANAFNGSFGQLGPVEKYLFRRLIPFYTFNKAMTMLAFRLPFIAPLSAFAWQRMSAWMTSLTQDPELPEWTHGYWPILAKADGSTIWVSMKGLSHSGGLRVSHFGNIPIPAMANLVETNPYINLIYRLSGGKTEFDRGVIPYSSDELHVNMHDGSVYKPVNGYWQKVQDQLPLLQGIAQMFPSVQLAEQIFTPYRITHQGWTGLPEPDLNPDGTYRYPREMLERIGQAVGVRSMTRSKEDIQRGEKLQAVQALKSMVKMIPKSSPDEKEAILNAVEDYRNGFLRQVKK